MKRPDGPVWGRPSGRIERIDKTCRGRIYSSEAVEKVFLECESLSEGSGFAGLSRFSDILEENRTSKQVHSGLTFSTRPSR